MELEKFLEYQGFDTKKIKELEEDKAKAEFDTSFIRKDVEAIRKDDIFKKINGKVIGNITTKTKALFKNHGVDFDTEEDMKGKEIEELIEIGLQKTKSNFETKITELEGKVGQTDIEAIKNLEKERDKFRGLADDFKVKWTTTGAEYEGYKNKVATDSKNKSLNELKEKAFASVKFKQDASTFEKKGFFSDFQENYTIELNEAGKLVPLKDGKGIPNPKKAGTEYEIEELLQERAIESKLYSLNPHGNKPVQTITQNPINLPAQPTRHVNQRAL